MNSVIRINENFVSCGGYLFQTTFDDNKNFNGNNKVYAAYLLVNPDDQDLFVLKESYTSDYLAISSIEEEVDSYFDYCLRKNKTPVPSKTIYIMNGLHYAGRINWSKSDDPHEGVETFNMPFNLFDKPLNEDINPEIPNYVSLDLIKESIDDCLNDRLRHVKAESIAKKIIDMLILRSCPYIVADGVDFYANRIAENASYNGYSVVFLNFNTPAKEFVESCFKQSELNLKRLYNDYITFQRLALDYKRLSCEHPQKYSLINIDWFTNKYLFLDLDGTICEYVKPIRDYEGDVDFVNSDIFIDPKPIENTIKWLNDWLQKNPSENLYILGACPNSISFERKKEWIKKNLVNFKLENFYWVGNKDYKHVFLRQFIQKNNLHPREVMIVDDSRETLESMEKIGVNPIHPTSLVYTG